jgi:hypothetical protein
VSGSLLRRPGFRWLWLGQTLLFAGVQFWFVAVTRLMLQRTGSGTSLALLLMAAALLSGDFALTATMTCVSQIGSASPRRWMPLTALTIRSNAASPL